MTTESNPSYKPAYQHSGCKKYANCLEWPLLDLVLSLIDYVFGSVATVPDSSVYRPHTIFHRIADD
jgi:hypothetical protein